MSKKLILIGLITIVCFVIICIVVLALVYRASIQTTNTSIDNRNDSTQDLTEDLQTEETIESDPITDFTDGNISIDSIPSIRDEDVAFKSAPQSNVPEMDLGKKTLELLQKTNWTGNNDDPLPLNVASYGDSYLTQLLEDEKSRGTSLTIPSNLEKYYISSEAEKEINTLIFQIREEFIEYIKEKGVNQKYIDEINNNALPNDSTRLKYKAINSPDVPPSVTTFLSNQESPIDYSKREFIIYSVDIYNGTRQFTDAGLVSDEDPKLLRDMGLRVLMYHEFAHILQKAVDTVHSNDPKSKNSWMNTDISLQKVTDRYDRNWGSEAINDARNREISNESQAEGLSFEMVTNLYDMSNAQKKLYWEFKFGRLEQARQDWSYIMDTFESKYPEFWADAFGTKIYKDVFFAANSSLKTSLLRIGSRLDAMGPYGGYFQPMKPEHTQEFWEYLKK